MKTQTVRILDYLKKHKKGITSIEAFELFGVTRLSAVIFELRKKYEIYSERTEGKNRYGEKVWFSTYRLIGEL